MLFVSTLASNAADSGGFGGIWCWGTRYHAEATPFLRISRAGSQWRIEIKHYMQDDFVQDARDVRVDGEHLAFAYWYEPLSRWARCSLDLMDDRMVGECDGERNAREWGAAPAYLWRSPPP